MKPEAQLRRTRQHYLAMANAYARDVRRQRKSARRAASMGDMRRAMVHVKIAEQAELDRVSYVASVLRLDRRMVELGIR